MRTRPPLVAPLFRSAGQAAILAEVLLTDAPISLGELASRTGLPRSSAYREVSRLADAGLLLVETVGREWQIRSNPDSPLTAPVRQILAVAFGPVPLLREHLSDIEGVEAAALFGSFAARATGVPGQAPHDIDVLVIGDADARVVYAACRAVGEVVGRQVNATIMSRNEWSAAVERRSAFAVDVTSHPTLPLMGEL
jgi:DNA-binding Lrp family transcriptional regulator